MRRSEVEIQIFGVQSAVFILALPAPCLSTIQHYGAGIKRCEQFQFSTMGAFLPPHYTVSISKKNRQREAAGVENSPLSFDLKHTVITVPPHALAGEVEEVHSLDAGRDVTPAKCGFLTEGAFARIVYEHPGFRVRGSPE
jgi:hypothetical protein